MEPIIELIPPLLASIGGIIPILLESLPASFDAKSKPLAMILLVSSIWVVYILMLSLGYSSTFFSPVITVLFLILGIAVLAILLGFSLAEIKVSKMYASAFYILSVICLVAGFSNYLLMQDNVVLRFAPSDDCPSIEQVQWENAEGTPIRLDYVESMFGIGVVWPNERFEQVKNVVLFCPGSTPEKPLKTKVISREEGSYRPWGAGKLYAFQK